jgi:hypothetical protein
MESIPASSEIVDLGPLEEAIAAIKA